tara:strand:+ start:673 stop:1857 length:1185 start_codon:yes stop_codon:yes gene_type:complete
VIGACAGPQRHASGLCRSTIVGFLAGSGTNGSGNSGAMESVIIGSCAVSYGQQLCKKIVIGHCAMRDYRDPGSHENEVIGNGAMMCWNCCAQYNTIIGSHALCDHSGNNKICKNVVIGTRAFKMACSVCENVVIGHDAASQVKCAVYSVIIGNAALSCAGNTSYSTSQDVYIGNNVAQFATKNNNTCLNVIIGTCSARCTSSGNCFCCGCCNVLIGSCINCFHPTNSIVIGTCACGKSSANTLVIQSRAGGTQNGGVCLYGCLIKGGGSFEIVHPNPEKSKDKVLYHSFVESPTRGDNLYRWSINVKKCKHSIKLPDYHKYLNENTTIKISSVGHFGKAYGKIDENQDNLIVCTNQDGQYNVLAIGTRCDAQALQDNFVIEKDMNENDIEQHKN